jgi:hypothetical protein
MALVVIPLFHGFSMKVGRHHTPQDFLDVSFFFLIGAVEI